MIRDLVHARLSAAVDALKSSGVLPADLDVSLEVADPKDPSHGDFACNFALAAAKQAGMNPRELGEKLRGELVAGDQGTEGPRDQGNEDKNEKRKTKNDGGGAPEKSIFESVEIAGPGFLNLRMADGAWRLGLEWANQAAGNLAKPGVLKNEKRKTKNDDSSGDHPLRLNVEFVSVNPNGPITVGSGRGAAFGSTLCNVLEAAGNEVHREYYINDGTNSEQMRLFAESSRFYVALRIFGEWGNSEHVEDWTGELLELINEFVKVEGDVSSMKSDELVSKWLSFAKNEFESLVHGRALGHLAVKNSHDTPYYNEERARQLRLYSREAWKNGEFEAPFLDFPEAGYRGDYVRYTAWQFVKAKDNAEQEFFEEAEKHIFDRNGLFWFQSKAERWMLDAQKLDLEDFATTFDTWFSEQSLHDSGKVEGGIRHLIANGSADERPIRTVLKLAKGGKIDEVQIVEQPNEEVDEEGTEGPREQGSEDKNEERKTKNEKPDSSDQRETASGHRLAANDSRNTLWLRSTKFADDMDRVLRRKDGRLTYIASDVAYHKDKFNRPPGPNGQGADKLITILGPDHHGYISRLHAVVAALLDKNEKRKTKNEESDFEGESDPQYRPLDVIEAKLYDSPEERENCLAALEEARERLEVIIFQIVRFVKEGKPAPMRKRDGNIYSLRDLMVEIGKDAAPHLGPEEQIVVGKDVARFFYLMRSHDTHMDFDIDLATKGTDENPVFYVQYAHARICSILKKSESEGLRAKGEAGNVNASSLTDTSSSTVPLHPRETALIKKVLDLPWEVQRCAQDYGVHRLTTYAIELARTFHHFYDACRVIQPEEPELTQRRLAICTATRHALQGALGLLGVSAPEKMERAEQNLEP